MIEAGARGRPAGLFLLAALAGSGATAADWPQWRGPRADGTSPEAAVTEWGPDRSRLWTVEVPGEGHSSPIVSGSSVFLTSALGDGRERALVRLDARTGRVLWSEVVVRSEDRESLHPENNYASSTPATDGRAVYTSFYANGRAHLAATAFDGRRLWEASPVRYRAEHGYHHDPLLLDGLLVLSFDQLDEAAVVGIDAGTGKTRWTVPLGTESCSNAAPLPVEAGGRRLVVTVGNDVTRGIDPATGRVVWRTRGPTDYVVASPAFGAGVLFVNGGYPDRRSLGLRVDLAGDVTGSAVLWESRQGTTYVPSPVYHDGHFYAVADGGVATCWEAKTGRVRWQDRLPGRFRASLVLAGGHLYATNDQGTTVVFRADPGSLQEVARNDLSEPVYATPAVAGGRVYVRTRSRLHALGAR